MREWRNRRDDAMQLALLAQREPRFPLQLPPAKLKFWDQWSRRAEWMQYGGSIPRSPSFKTERVG